MENISPRYSRASQLQSSALASSSSSSKQRRSGYEPSDTETEWQQQESPWLDHTQQNGVLGSEGSRMTSITPRNVSPMKPSRKHASMFEYDNNKISPIRAGVISPVRRRHSRSPYKPQRDDGNIVSPKPSSDLRRNVSPFSKSERRSRHVSPFKGGREDQNLGNEDEIVNSNRKQGHRLHNNHLGSEEKLPDHLDASRLSEKPHSRRSLSAARLRGRERDQQNNNGHTEKRGGERTPSPLARSQPQKEREASHVKAPSVGELNEMVASARISRVQACDPPNFESIDSISPGDIFFSRDCTALAMQKNVLPKTGVIESRFAPPKPKVITEWESASNQRNGRNGSYDQGNQRNSSSSALSRTTTISSSAVSRQSSGRISTTSSKMSDTSGRTTASMKKFTANRRKSQTEINWFSCMKKGPCKTSKSPEHRAFDEASFIEKAFVVQELRQFWADKHRPGSLNGFTCHKQQAQLLKQFVSSYSIYISNHLILGSRSVQHPESDLILKPFQFLH